MLARIYLIVFILLSVTANASEIYIVRNIKISASDKNSSIARNIAIEKGQIKAFNLLVRQYYPKAIDKSSELKDDVILDTVAGFELANEKRSTTNYVAQITVKFSRDDVDKLMRSMGARFNAGKTPAKKEELDTNPPSDDLTVTTLLVPIYEKDEQMYWLDDDNSWLSFWRSKLRWSNKDLFTLPAGDIEDISLLNNNILNKNLNDLEPLFERYGVNNIAVLKVGDLQDNPYHLTLQVNYINQYSYRWQQYNFADLEGENLEELYNQSYDEIKQFNFVNQAGTTKDAANYLITDSHEINIDFPIEKISDWLELEKVLSTSRYISKLDLKVINASQYNFSINYNVSFLDLKAFFKQYKLTLQDRRNNKFLLMRDISSAEY
jgi:hypothetical protein